MPTKKQCSFLSDEDILLGLRYAYYINNISAVPDVVYDKWEEKCLRTVPQNSLLKKPGSDNKEDYPDRIRALGMYFTFLMVKKEGDELCSPKLDSSKLRAMLTEKVRSKAVLKFKPKNTAKKKVIEID